MGVCALKIECIANHRHHKYCVTCRLHLMPRCKETSYEETHMSFAFKGFGQQFKGCGLDQIMAYICDEIACIKP